jgi:hypothetical protein
MLRHVACDIEMERFGACRPEPTGTGTGALIADNVLDFARHSIQGLGSACEAEIIA